MKVLSPAGERNEDAFKDQLALRPATLQGKIIGIVDNRAGKAYFQRIEEFLRTKCGVGDVRRWVKPEQVAPASAELIDEIAKSCDAAVVGAGV